MELDWWMLWMAYMLEDNKMLYRCDTCGCYLDPGEGRTCDECKEQIERRSQKRETIKEAIRLNENNQYEMILQEVI